MAQKGLAVESELEFLRKNEKEKTMKKVFKFFIIILFLYSVCDASLAGISKFFMNHSFVLYKTSKTYFSFYLPNI